ncbi:DUF3789 domain-containing protein [Ruminococcus sp. XPD3002]
MGHFITGMFVGGIVGVFTMALCTAAKWGDKDER